MAIYLDEDMIGSDPAKIGFPHLVFCMGVVVLMEDGSLIGGHSTAGKVNYQAFLRAMRNSIGNSGMKMNRMYCIGDLRRHYEFEGATVPEKANALGFTGEALEIDLAQICPENGSYAEVVSNGPDLDCTVKCAKNKDILYMKANRFRERNQNVPKVRLLQYIRGTDWHRTRSKFTDVSTVNAAVDPTVGLRVPYGKRLNID